MEIEVSYEQQPKPVTIFRLQGELNITSHELLEEQARQAHAAGTKDLLLDLTEVNYVSSAGIRTLNSMMKLLRTDAPEESDAAMSQGLRDGTFKSPHLKLLNPNQRSLEALRLAGMDMLFEIHHDREAALASF